MEWLELPFHLVTPRQVLAAGFTLPLVCIVLVCLRVYVRKLQKTGLGIDDWLIAFGVLMITGMGACLITGERLGVMGYPTPVPDGTLASEASTLFLEDFILQAKIQFGLQFLMCFAYGFVKTSIVCFCRRIFVGHKGSAFDWASRAVIVLAASWSIAFLMTLVFGCGKHVALHWAPLQVVQAQCDVSTPQQAMVISDLILDLIIILLPFPSIWNLSMATPKKLAVTTVFLVGMMSVVASIVRLAIYLTVLYKGYGAGYDINRTATTMLWWSMLEGALAAIAACLPTLTFLFKDVSVWQLFSRLRSISGLSGSWRLSGNEPNSREKFRPSLGDHSDTIGRVDSNSAH